MAQQTITADERKRVKGQGFLSNNDGEHFSCRVITENGTMTADQLANVAKTAQTYGNGTVSFTTRLTVEIPGISYQDIVPVQEMLAQEGLETGGTGAKVRPVVACKGTVCVFGLADTQDIAREVHQRFYKGYEQVKLPHKFKVGVGGCPNNCIKPDLNDFGMMGQRVPQLQEDLCKGCKKCGVAENCKMKAAKVEDGKMVRDSQLCNNCGACVEKCHFQAVKEQKRGIRIFVGGKWGRSDRKGTPLPGIYTREEALDILEKAILFFKDQGYAGERFGNMIDRVGIEATEKALLGDELLARKEEILAAPIRTR